MHLPLLRKDKSGQNWLTYLHTYFPKCRQETGCSVSPSPLQGLMSRVPWHNGLPGKHKEVLTFTADTL